MEPSKLANSAFYRQRNGNECRRKRAVMLCCWEVNTGTAHSTRGSNLWVAGKPCDPCFSLVIPERLRDQYHKHFILQTKVCLGADIQSVKPQLYIQIRLNHDMSYIRQLSRGTSWLRDERCPRIKRPAVLNPLGGLTVRDLCAVQCARWWPITAPGRCLATNDATLCRSSTPSRARFTCLTSA